MRLTGHRCRCAGCGEYFRRTSAFDKHRTGDYRNRRCLKPIEMEAKGMAKLDNGVWVGSSWLAHSDETATIRTYPLPTQGLCNNSSVSAATAAGEG